MISGFCDHSPEDSGAGLMIKLVVTSAATTKEDDPKQRTKICPILIGFNESDGNDERQIWCVLVCVHRFWVSKTRHVWCTLIPIRLESMAQETFLVAFDNIDRDGDGIINYQDLEEYAKQDTVSEDFVRKWKNLFDPEGTGKITFEHFCNTLGINKKKQQELMSLRQPLVYHTNMDAPTKTRVLTILRNHWVPSDPDSSMHPSLMNLDDEFGPRWQSRVLFDKDTKDFPGQYITYSLDGGKSNYAVWKAPEQKRKEGGCCAC
ncbi:unnamed protein product [Calicophoron daubneyi]|uniref:EF-hand domain-containing protein n=1 Tax=Calicophoron daubneyi TaxID=300641 RepID=A0AAV2TU74_CALDB